MPRSNPGAALERAIEVLGGLRAAGRKLKVTHQAIYHWRDNGCDGLGPGNVPARRALQIEKATGRKVMREELRPDLYR